MRLCDCPACSEPAEHRAPRSPEHLSNYYWFCRDHAREYNESWNYCVGMSETDIERQIRRDTTWRRPSWPFAGKKGDASWMQFDVEDPLGVLGGEAPPNQDHEAHNDHNRRPSGPAAQAARILGLEPPITLAKVKERYKQLAKKHHPDATGGDMKSEERLKVINQAYNTLRRALS